MGEAGVDANIDYQLQRHRFPPKFIAHAIWLYVRFNFSLRDVEEILLERGIDVSYETVRRWTIKFGPHIAGHLRRRQPCPGGVWHLDEVVVKIAGKKFWLWRAVDQHGVVLAETLQSRRDKRAAKRLLVKLIKRHGLFKRIIADELRLYGAAEKGQSYHWIARGPGISNDTGSIFRVHFVPSRKRPLIEA